MYKGLLIDPSGGDEALKKQEIPEARLSIPPVPLPSSLDWRDYGRPVLSNGYSVIQENTFYILNEQKQKQGGSTDYLKGVLKSRNYSKSFK